MNLVERLLDWERREPQRVWLCQPIDDVERRYTFAQAPDEVRRAAMAIRALGLPAGSRTAISGRNPAPWLIAAQAISLAGPVAVAQYWRPGKATHGYIPEHADIPDRKHDGSGTCAPVRVTQDGRRLFPNNN